MLTLQADMEIKILWLNEGLAELAFLHLFIFFFLKHHLALSEMNGTAHHFVKGCLTTFYISMAILALDEGSSFLHHFNRVNY